LQTPSATAALLLSAKEMWQSLVPKQFAPLAEVVPSLVQSGIVYYRDKRPEAEAAARAEDEAALGDDAELHSKATARSNRYNADLQKAQAAFQTSLAAFVTAQSRLQAAVVKKANLATLLLAMDSAAAVAAAAATGWRNAAWRLRASLRALADAAELDVAIAAKATAVANLVASEAAATPKPRYSEPPTGPPRFSWTDEAVQCLVATVQAGQNWNAVAAAVSQKLRVACSYQQCYNKYYSLKLAAPPLPPPPPPPPPLKPAISADRPKRLTVAKRNSTADVGAAQAAAPPPPPPPPIKPAVSADRPKRLAVAKRNVDRMTNDLAVAKDFAKATTEADSQLEIAQRAAHEAAELAWLSSSVLKVHQAPKQSKPTTLLSIMEQQLKLVSRRLAKTQKELQTAQERFDDFHEVPKQLRNGEKKERLCWLRRCYPDPRLDPDKKDTSSLLSVRNEALRSLKHNYFSNIAKQKVDGRSFHLQFKSKKQRQTSFEVGSENWNHVGGFWAALRDAEQCKAERHRRPDVVGKTRVLPSEVDHTVRLLQTRFGQLYVVLRFHVKGASEKQGAYRVAACDPGLRRVLSVFDVNNNRLVKLGDGAIRRIYGLLQRRDQLALCCRTDLEEIAPSMFKALQKIGGPMTHKRRHHMRRKLARLDQRISNVVDGMHRDMAKWLCTHFDLILLPRFGTSEMIRRTNRTIGKRTARGLQMLAFHRFEERLKAMAARHGCTVVICSEEWTSKTCPSCRHINMDLGSSLLFCCENCAFTSDRDFVGALNILAKFVADHRQQQRRAQQPQAQASTAQAQAAKKPTTTTIRPDSSRGSGRYPHLGKGSVERQAN
jgi:transposase